MTRTRKRSGPLARALPAALLRTATLLALAVVGIAGCGGDDDDSGPSRFESDTFPFTFEYPDGFEVTDEVSLAQELGGAADETVAIVMDDDNGLLLQRFTLKREINQGTLNLVKQELDSLAQRVDPGAAPGEPGELAGFLSLTYDAVALTTPEDGESRLIVLFDGDQEYLINCQSIPDGREQIEEACDLAVETLAPSDRPPA
jgi:hypothetical protein